MKLNSITGADVNNCYYKQSRRLLILAEELDTLSIATVVAIRQNFTEVAGELAQHAAHNALILLECKEAIERVFNDDK